MRRASGALPVVLIVVLPVAAIVAIAVFAVVILTQPQAGDGQSTSGTGQVQEQPAGDDQPPADRSEAAVRAAATDYFDLYVAGDYGGSWDRTAAASRELVSREDYIRVHQLCQPLVQGIRFEIKTITLNGDLARLNVTRLIAAFTYEMVYENDQWRMMLSTDAQVEYRGKTVEQVAEARHAKRICKGDPPPQFSPSPLPSYNPQPSGAVVSPLSLPGT
ncbi:nuclear transport factor 2 family protein [Nonomuraea glycinis]|nr:hypothetical protein [Nonomuraea glycinis]MCA2178502.1 nuclear transport factor 2 family protein [Nonomuraea glycinis]